MPKILRTAHGKGRAALIRAEMPPLDELKPPNAGDTERGLAMSAARGRPFEAGNRAAENRKPALCSLGVPIETSDPRYRSAMRKAASYRNRRVRELTVLHGGYLGAGPTAMLSSAARSLAASIVISTLAGEALARNEIDASTKLFLAAARLADAARSQELTAVGLAEREAAATDETDDEALMRERLAYPNIDD